MRWLDGNAPGHRAGRDLGNAVAARQAEVREELRAARRRRATALPLQSWPLAYWPDGSLKWTATRWLQVSAPAMAPSKSWRNARRAKTRAAPSPSPKLPTAFEVDTGVVSAASTRKGAAVIGSVTRDGREALRDGKLVLLRQDRAAGSDATVVTQESFESVIEKVTLEQRGPVRAVLKIEGKHAQCRRRVPGCPSRCGCISTPAATRCACCTPSFSMATRSQDFIRGVGLRFTRRPRMPSSTTATCVSSAIDGGVFGEAVRGLTGLRRDAGAAARKAQVEGDAVPSLAPAVSNLQQYIPAFGDWTLFQPNADSFTIRKRTADGHAWLDSGRGSRASGLGYFGGPGGGIAFGIRNFWQSHPAQLDIRGAHGDAADGHHVGVGAGCAADGPALLSRWSRPGHVREAVQGRPRDHLRGLRARLRHAAWAWRAPAS